MQVCIDIDQTISTGHVGNSVQESLDYYRAQGIALPESAVTYRDFFGLPEIIKIHEVLPGALEGVRKLQKLGDPGYFTVRKGHTPQFQAAVEENTRFWLRENNFPHALAVSFFPGMLMKLAGIASQAVPGRPIVLVDDNWQKVLTSLALLDASDDAPRRDQAVLLKEHLTLVAIGAQSQDVPTVSEITILPLQTWAEIDDVVHVLENKEVFYAIRRNTTRTNRHSS